MPVMRSNLLAFLNWLYSFLATLTITIYYLLYNNRKSISLQKKDTRCCIRYYLFQQLPCPSGWIEKEKRYRLQINGLYINIICTAAKNYLRCKEVDIYPNEPIHVRGNNVLFFAVCQVLFCLESRLILRNSQFISWVIAFA